LVDMVCQSTSQKGIDSSAAYIMDPDAAQEIAINIKLLERAVLAAEHLSKNLKFVVLPTGTKRYGVHMIDEFPFKKDLPLKESLGKIPEPQASQMFYYNQMDTLRDLAKGKSWSWAEVIPDVIIGFVPNNNIYCLPQHLGLYLSLYRYLNGEGAEVQFPGTTQSYKNLFNDSFQDSIAKFSIYAALNGLGNGEGYNTCGSGTPASWSQRWPIICEYFGLKGVAPPADGSGPQPYDYVVDHKADWDRLAEEKGLKKGSVGNDRSYGGFPYFIMR
jgi:nucleoside-diphosphate-sugar epimerase